MNFIICFRAKPKSRPAAKGEKDKDGKPVKGIVGLGFMPLGASEYLYEMTARGLLPPNSNGVPVWKSDEVGEKTVFKLPRHFEHIFLPPHQLCEEDGEKMATWALGVHAPPLAPKKAPPSFSAHLEWEGQQEWAGKPLADAPHAALLAYGIAVEAAIATTKSEKKAAAIRAHLVEVQAAAKEASKV